MADQPPHLDKVRLDQQSSVPATPGWVKAFGIAALVIFAVIVGLHLTGRGMGGHHVISSPSP